MLGDPTFSYGYSIEWYVDYSTNDWEFSPNYVERRYYTDYGGKMTRLRDQTSAL